MRSKGWCALWLGIALLGPAAPGAGQDAGAPADQAGAPAEQARQHVEALLEQVEAIARDPGATPDQKRALLEREIESQLDLAFMSKVALGPEIERFSQEEFVEFSQEFERYLTLVYLRRIAAFDEESVVVREANADPATGIVTVRTLGGTRGGAYKRTLLTTKPTRLDVDYFLHERRGEWRILGITIEGVDVARNFRSQFESYLGRGDPQGLIQELRKRNAAAENPFAS